MAGARKKRAKASKKKRLRPQRAAQQRIDGCEKFIQALDGYPWFASAGETATDARVARDFSDAVDGHWDGWVPRARPYGLG